MPSDIANGSVCSIHYFLLCTHSCVLFSFSKTIIFRDANQEPLVLLATHAKIVLKALLDSIVARIEAIFPGELFPDDSTRSGFQFLALHFGWYLKYSERVCTLHLLDFSQIVNAILFIREMVLLLQEKLTLITS